ncbi:ABC transporter permease [Conexibacter arvalis]|uniref:Putative spermidine/putrescine transport system permease protein n=1 Tax=Conexibacter arvalis TaxID=912552 RepID=A0A840I8W5_9ACTN|nr:ABC transporter permease [Conexibacter arvalis]MBB4660584.1 putative spermidine/putrescine transport system permease protein [Conexibacter arvalis]
MSRTRDWPLYVVMAVVILFLLSPLIVVVGASVTTSSFLEFPPRGFSLKWFEEVLGQEVWTTTLITSVKLAVVSMAIATVVGIPCSIALARGDFRGRAAITAFVLSPLMVPSIVLAISLLIIYSRTGIDLPFWRLALAHGVLTAPYLIRTLTAALEQVDSSLEEAARNLGATPVGAWLRVVLPTVRPALIAAMFFAFIMSFDELVVALFLSGPRLTTLPMQIYGEIQYNLSPAIAAVSTLLIFLTVAGVLVIERVLGVRRLVR